MKGIKETGIIMSGNHPKLIIDKLKTMTRRTWGLEEINKNPDAWERIGYDQSGRFSFRWIGGDRILNVKCPYGQAGDRLWVREKHTFLVHGDDNAIDYFVAYFDGTSKRIDGFPTVVEAHSLTSNPQTTWRWHPSIFMPRWASRLTLEITGLRAERLQDITEGDAEAEGESWSPVGGGENPEIISAIENYSILWDSLNAKRGYAWVDNHWVWPISFKEVKGE